MNKENQTPPFGGGIQVDVITPEKTFFSGQASMVQVPGYEGVFGVLPGHAPFISLLKPGVIIIDSAEGQKKIAVAAGISEATAHRCTVLADSAVDCAAVTRADIDSRIQQAKAALTAADNDEERKAAEKKLALAEALELGL